VETFQFMGMGIATTIIGSFVTAFVALPVVIYIVARARQMKEGTASDPQMGMKVALYLFKVLGFQLLLAGLFLLLYGLMSDGGREPIMRMAAGLLVPGLMIFVGHLVAIGKSNDLDLPTVGRMFSGWNIVQTGLSGSFALIAACVLTFTEGVPTEPRKMAWIGAVVYLSAWVALLALFVRRHVPNYPGASSQGVPPRPVYPGYPPQQQGGGYYDPQGGGGHNPQGGGYGPQGG
jgi:hypothetical protein